MKDYTHEKSVHKSGDRSHRLLWALGVLIMDFELLYIYLGHLAVLIAAVYFFFKGNRLIGTLFIMALLLQLQGLFTFQFLEMPEDQGSCWLDKMSYYACIPLIQRISIHAGQFGQILLAIAIFLTARKMHNSELNRGNE